MKKKLKKILAPMLMLGCLAPVAAPMISPSTVMAATQANPVNKWVRNPDNTWSFYKNGVKVTGWRWMTAADGEKTPHWSYFDKNGKMYTEWHNMGKNEGEKTPHWSYFGEDGWLRTGWQHMGKGTRNPDNNSALHWSYFGDNGWLRTGLQEMGRGTSNPDDDSYRHLSYFGGNGWLVENRDFSANGSNYRANGAGWAININNKQLDGSLWSISGRKTAYVGDSRTVQTYNYKTGGNGKEVKSKIGNEYWFASWGQGIIWYNNNKSTLFKNVDKNTDVVWLLGINDCSWGASKHISALKELAGKVRKVYFVSVNRTNNYRNSYGNYDSMIPNFNAAVKRGIAGTNITYIDSYNAINLNNKFESDRLHFKRDGAAEVMKYVMSRI